MDYEDKIVRLLSRKNYVPMTCEEIASKIRAPEVHEVSQLLSDLTRSGQIVRIKGNRYSLPDVADLVVGRIQIHRSGAGTLYPDDASHPPVDIAPNHTSTAMLHDRVLVRLIEEPIWRVKRRRGKPNDGPSGKVIQVLERARTRVVGTLKRSDHYYFVIPDDPRIPLDIFVDAPRKGNGKNFSRPGDKVLIEIEDWVSQHQPPEGKIMERLGRPDDPGVDMLSILSHYDLNKSFPANVLAEVDRLPDKVTEGDLKGRKDCRNHDVITIDPFDAKDFDDAFYLKKEKDGRWRLWVHIADVSHYVKPGTALDDEARARGNSTYLVDRVIPMLPEKLSNGICSLNPKVDRLSKCAEFLIGTSGQIEDVQFYSAVIHSKRRFSYEEAFDYLSGSKKPETQIENMLLDANRLAQMLRRARFRSGALELESPENKIILDKDGKLDKVIKVENDESHQLIEEFMLLANEAVAAELRKRRKNAIYRVHEDPDPEKLDEFAGKMEALGIKVGEIRNQKAAQRAIRKLKEHPAAPVLRIAFLRSLKRARYAVEPIGHYGLAKADYLHFTSPIRRYADLIAHQVLFTKSSFPLKKLTQAADHISFTERNSADAEMDSKRIKLLIHLEQQLMSGRRETYEGIVSDVRNMGFFVEAVDLGMSGMIRSSSLEDDFYVYDPLKMALVGKHRKKVIALGDRLKVRVTKVDLYKKQVDFQLASLPGGNKGRSSQKRSERHPRRDEGPAKKEQAPKQEKRRSRRSRRRR